MYKMYAVTPADAIALAKAVEQELSKTQVPEESWAKYERVRQAAFNGGLPLFTEDGEWKYDAKFVLWPIPDTEGSSQDATEEEIATMVRAWLEPPFLQKEE
jgi:hypothetical protein